VAICRVFLLRFHCIFSDAKPAGSGRVFYSPVRDGLDVSPLRWQGQ
jgi:hypothetical protein